MYINTLNNNINAIQCLQKELGVKLNKALTLGISDKECLEKDNMLITAILRVLYNAVGTPFEVDSNTAAVTSIITLTYTNVKAAVVNVQVGPVAKPSLGIYGSPYDFCSKRGETITSTNPDTTSITLNTQGCPLDDQNCLTDDELCNLIEMAYSILKANCCY